MIDESRASGAAAPPAGTGDGPTTPEFWPDGDRLSAPEEGAYEWGWYDAVKAVGDAREALEAAKAALDLAPATLIGEYALTLIAAALAGVPAGPVDAATVEQFIAWCESEAERHRKAGYEIAPGRYEEAGRIALVYLDGLPVRAALAAVPAGPGEYRLCEICKGRSAVDKTYPCRPCGSRGVVRAALAGAASPSQKVWGGHEYEPRDCGGTCEVCGCGKSAHRGGPDAER